MPRSESWPAEDVTVTFRGIVLQDLWPGSYVTADRNKDDVIRGAVNHDHTGRITVTLSDPSAGNVEMARLDDETGPLTVTDRDGTVLVQAVDAWKQTSSGQYPGWTKWSIDVAKLEFP